MELQLIGVVRYRNSKRVLTLTISTSDTVFTVYYYCCYKFNCDGQRDRLTVGFAKQP